MKIKIQLPGKFKVASHFIDRPLRNNIPLVVQICDGEKLSIYIRSLEWKEQGKEWLLIIAGVVAETERPFSAEVNNSDGVGTLEVSE
ncbi:MAG: hypothetical protein WCG02_01375 [Candidatus Taylorbacteria bacterium]